MGLASHFGDQASYKCKNCGYTMTLYAPCCPKCLDTALIKLEKSPEKFKNTVNEDSRESTKSVHPAVPFVALAALVAIAVAGFMTFAPPRPELKTDPGPRVGSTARPPSSSVRVSNNRAIKRSRPVISKTRSTSSSSAPKPATPMKLWEASGDE